MTPDEYFTDRLTRYSAQTPGLIIRYGKHGATYYSIGKTWEETEESFRKSELEQDAMYSEYYKRLAELDKQSRSNRLIWMAVIGAALLAVFAAAAYFFPDSDFITSFIFGILIGIFTARK